jgi:predicted nucleic acid-binding protein
MALTHLLDTSVLTRLGNPEIRAAIDPKTQLGQLARAGISDLEIGYSARNDSEWELYALYPMPAREKITAGETVRSALS